MPLHAKSADGERLAVHTMTTKPLSLAEAAEAYASRGIGGISVWVETLAGLTNSAAKQIIDDAGLKVPALVRGGFFCAANEHDRQERVDHNRRLIETAAALEAEMLVLVVGALPGQPLDVQRGWVRDGIEGLLAEAQSSGVKLAIEPLHPMYAADKSCINRITEARQICEAIDDAQVGVAVDVYHVWWDPELSDEIRRLGETNRIFGFHLCDWRVPTRDLLTDRALMGDGCIDIAGIRGEVEAAGFEGWNEVEIFSEEHWASDQGEYLDKIVERYRTATSAAGH
ncbi:sugar phosphate isomerase/epimerase family protein [Roseimaritima ulvae]|uniref:Xylose isomerase-like TIM barrel n=1 Tax=Roseimaritima ulvae TaxID=980254 RepID=A0A5B9QRF4_9BACT|nr:sugar phosphate isomerase/epimerase family protein [Roseimaritima ulvae]QEG39636.1 Xylose isomerase-like TIM barrel [Roseimaritima ulvae]